MKQFPQPSFLTKLFALFLSAMFTFAVQAQTKPSFGNASDLFAEQEPEFLQVDEAFIFDFAQKDEQLKLRWQIADGYYLYKKQLKIVAKDASLGEIDYPPAREMEDEFFGLSEVYFNEVELTSTILNAKQDAVVKVRYQGCAEAGLCYPPTVREVFLSAVGDSISPNNAGSANATNSVKATAQTQQDYLSQLLETSDNTIWVLGLFFILGLGLAFTPCVFPMYPILSGIIVGQGEKLQTGKAFVLSFTYVQGMALTYSALGLVVASAGMQYQAALQHPYVLISLAVLFFILSLSMFGVYDLNLPAKWQEKLTQVSNNQKGGEILGVFAMGVLSGLVASPCTTAPLSGALIYVAQTGDLVFGGAALYALSLGMGLPLLVLGTSGGKLLPKAGAWMNVVKVTFGFMLIAVSILMLERMLNEFTIDLLWAIWLLATFSYFFTVNTSSALSFWKGVRSFIIFIGIFSGAFLGYQTLFPNQVIANQASFAQHAEFVRVRDIGDIETKVSQAAAQGKYVMLDLYADWCVACKEFEKYTFPDPAVKQYFDTYFVLLQADLTSNTPGNLDIQDEFDVLGLPTMLFFDLQGKEIDNLRVTGFMQAQPFAEHLEQVISVK